MKLKLKNRKAISSYLLQYAIRIERALIYNMEVMVAELENHAKLSAEYNDQTGNLKGSIGGVVLKNGKPISYAGFNSEGNDGTDVATGVETGLEFINSLKTNYGKGYVMLIVAGMEYATYVEDMYDLNVLKRSELKMQRDLPVLLARLKRKIK